MWWRSEKIGPGDFVRLNVLDKTVKVDGVTLCRHVFLQVHQIIAEQKGAPGIVEYLFVGALYDLLDDEGEIDAHSAALPPPPVGYKFRRVLESQVAVPGHFIQGRYFAGLMDHPAVAQEPLKALGLVAELGGLRLPVSKPLLLKFGVSLEQIYEIVEADI